MLELEGKEVCCSVRMALIPRFAFFVLLLLPYQCKAMGENCRETECRLLPEKNDVASDFSKKASEKGVKLVYINFLDFSYYTTRWVWAHTADKPLLSLPEYYHFLSASLLKNYQVKSIDVELKAQPNQCLYELNLTCQYLAVGRVLLQNVTSSISSEKNTSVVCVAVINTIMLRANMWHNCCYVHNATTRPATIRCNERIYAGEWVNVVCSFLSFFFTLLAPALPVALPDYVFNIEDEVEKENHPAKQTNIETTGYQRITNPPTVGQQGKQRGTAAYRSNMEDVTATNDDNDTIQEETGQNTWNFLGNRRDKRKEREFIPVDDSSPIILSTLLRESVKRFPDVPLSFNVKLAVMCFCVYPCVLYFRIGLHHIYLREKKMLYILGLFLATIFIPWLWNSYSQCH